MNKLLLIAGLAVAAAIYFVFIGDPYPSRIVFQDIEFDSKDDINDTVDQKYDIISYRDKSNHHVLVFGIRNDSIRTLEELTKLYLLNFKNQGFRFEGQGLRHFGAKGDEAIYMTRMAAIDGVVIYIRKGATRDDEQGVRASVFGNLESITF